MTISRQRRVDLDRAKGLVILLVVFGHLVARADPAGVTWYEPLRRGIYAFHMPFFLYLSGLVAVLSGAVLAPPALWLRLFRRRANRLLVPFLAMGVLIVCGKLVASHFVLVDNRPASLGSGLLGLLWHTEESPAISIWYLFVLFVLSIMAPILVWLGQGRLNLLIAVFLVLYWVHLPAFIYLNRIGTYGIFFVAGALAGVWGSRWDRFVQRFWLFSAAAFVGALVAIVWFGGGWPAKLELLPVGLLAMPALHGLVRYSSLESSTVLLWLGRNSFMIYLFNTIFIGAAKGLLLRVTSWDGAHFLPVAAIMMLSGSLGPVLLSKVAAQQVRLIRRASH